MVDRLSNWIEIVPVEDTSAKTTALAIQRHWILRYGMPKFLHSDLGTCFTSSVFQELCKIYGITSILASSQNHKSISRAESAHKLILSGFRKICDKAENWIAKLPGLLLSLHSLVQTTTGICVVSSWATHTDNYANSRDNGLDKPNSDRTRE